MPAIMETDQERKTDEMLQAYESRRALFASVAHQLFAMGLTDKDFIVEVAIARSDFEFYMRAEEEWRGRLRAVGPSIDGTDLKDWSPPEGVDFFVLLNVLEQIGQPFTLMAMMRARARKGVIAVVLNPERALGDSHLVTPISTDDFDLHGWKASATSYFGGEADSIIAIYSNEGKGEFENYE